MDRYVCKVCGYIYDPEKAFYATYLFKLLRPKTKFVSVIGSFLWGTNMLKYIEETIKGMNVEIIEPVIFEGHPKETDLEKIKKLSEKIYQKHKELNLI